MKFPTPSDRDCVICYEEVSQDLAEHRTIRVPCCGRYFHRSCIQRYAVISGKEHFNVPALLQTHYPQHGPYLGVYARVVRGGSVQKGDALVVEAPEPSMFAKV